MVEVFKHTDYFSTPDFRLAIQTTRVGSDPVHYHRHEFNEIAIVTGGKGVHQVEGEEFGIAKGDVFVINSPIVHGYTDAEELVITNILYDPDQTLDPRPEIHKLPGYHALFILEPFYRQSHRFQSKLNLQGLAFKPLIEIIDRMQQEHDRAWPGYETMLSACFLQLVVYLSRMYSLQKPPQSDTIVRLSNVISHIESNYHEPIMLDDLVSISHMSKNTLLRTFKKVYKYSPVDYLIRLRLNKACEMMHDRDLSISEIAYATGFSDSNYFTRQFRKIYGTTPSVFRRRLIADA